MRGEEGERIVRHTTKGGPVTTLVGFTLPLFFLHPSLRQCDIPPQDAATTRRNETQGIFLPASSRGAAEKRRPVDLSRFDTRWCILPHDETLTPHRR